MELLIIIALATLNGLFAMSELAVVSATTAKLRDEANTGDPAAQAALKLAESPNRFLSTVQIGISLIGIAAGAFGGSAIVQDVATFIRNNISALEGIADQLAFALIIGLITYLQLIVGELVPKRIALTNPEEIAIRVAQPMRWLSILAAPLVAFLSASTSFVVGLLGISTEDERKFTDREVVSMIREGIRVGAFETAEQEMVAGALELDDLPVRAIATPRPEIVWLDISDDAQTVSAKLQNRTYSAYPVCDGKIDDVLGIVRAKDLLTHALASDGLDLQPIMRPALFVPESVQALNVLDRFKQSAVHLALLVGEYGGIQGIVTLNDIVEEVFGDVDREKPYIKHEADGGWLMDGQTPLDELQRVLSGLSLPDDERGRYHTLGGFLLARFGDIPAAGTSQDWMSYRFTIQRMDGKRVASVRVTEITD